MSMARHDHQLHEGESLTRRRARAADREGEQWTDMRAAVFDALAELRQAGERL